MFQKYYWMKMMLTLLSCLRCLKESIFCLKSYTIGKTRNFKSKGCNAISGHQKSGGLLYVQITPKLQVYMLYNVQKT